MDLFYYWKDFELDRKAGRIGRLRSTKDRLASIQEYPSDLVWVFKTPKGKKGQLQLLAKLRWSSTPPAGFKPQPGEAYIYYDPADAESQFFLDGDSPEALALVSGWVSSYLGSAVTANFQGANGQHAMRGDMLIALRRIAASHETRPFRDLLTR